MGQTQRVWSCGGGRIQSQTELGAISIAMEWSSRPSDDVALKEHIDKGTLQVTVTLAVIQVHVQVEWKFTKTKNFYFTAFMHLI